MVRLSPPNNALQRTGTGMPAAELGSLGGMIARVGGIFVALIWSGGLCLAQPPTPSIQLRIAVDSPIQAGRSYKVHFQVRNTGTVGFYFKRPWKWATNGLYLDAVGPQGLRAFSETLILDIDAKFVCTYIKPLQSGETFGFDEELRWDSPSPRVKFPGPGRYRVRWVYAPQVYDSDSACVAAGWHVWEGATASPEIEVEVVK